MTEINYNDLYGKSGIYAIVNETNGKTYVGRTLNLKKRKYEHFNLLRQNKHKNVHMQRSYNNNPESFVFKVLEFCDKELLDDREIYYIKELNTIDNGYNLCEGGGTTTGYHFTEEQKKKISESNKGKKHSPEIIEKRTASLKKHLAEDPEFAKEYKRKLSERSRGNTWNKGRHLSEEHKKVLSEKMKGRYISPEHKKILSQLYRGSNAVGAKLTENEVIEMRLRFLKGEKRMDIAKDYPHITPNHVFDIVKGKRWIYVPNTIEELEELLNGRKEVQL